jgi:probable HAF family extracellular repeat protein
MNKNAFKNLVRRTKGFFTLALLIVTGLPAPLAAQEKGHHHYKLIDIGTLGGPSSYFDDLALSDRFGFLPFIFEIAPALNKQGVLAGWADTTTSDPNPAFCFNPDCFVAHAFEWRKGIMTDLGALPGGASSAALWLNSKGWTVGMSQNGVIDPLTGIPEVRGVVWKNGQTIDLGTFGGNVSYASAVNDRGQVAGTALNAVPDEFSFYDLLFTLPGTFNGTQTRAFLWDEEHGMQDLGTLGGANASAVLVNQRGQVAGMSYTNSVPNATTGIPTFHPFLWDREKGMTDLGSLGGTELGSVNGLNERGQVVGATTIAGDQQLHPFLWDGEKLIDLIAPPFGGDGNGEAGWINEAGEIVGSAGVPASCPPGSLVGPIQHAFLWRKGVMMDLGTVAGTTNSEGDFINSRSQIVGLAWTCNYSFTAILWENGSMVDLNTLIPLGSPFQLYSASFIDDRGEIAAFGSRANGDSHALLLVPCDEDHPNVEGCDYSLVEDSTGEATQANIAALIGGTQQKLTPSQIQNRVRTALMSLSRRFGTRLPK